MQCFGSWSIIRMDPQWFGSPGSGSDPDPSAMKLAKIITFLQWFWSLTFTLTLPIKWYIKTLRLPVLNCPYLLVYPRVEGAHLHVFKDQAKRAVGTLTRSIHLHCYAFINCKDAIFDKKNKKILALFFFVRFGSSKPWILIGSTALPSSHHFIKTMFPSWFLDTNSPNRRISCAILLQLPYCFCV